MRNKSAVITGSNGFLGKNLIKRLSKLNYDITLIKDKININTNLEDIIDKDYLFHFAWQTDLAKSMKNPRCDLTNDLGGLINILEECKKQKSKLKIIFPSTVTVAGDIKNIPSSGNEREKPLSIYDTNKLTAEHYLNVYYKNYGINFSCLRLSNVFGEGQRFDNPNRGVVNFMIGNAIKGKELNIYGDGEWIRDYSYVQNYIDAFIMVAESKKTNGQTYVLGSGKGRTFNEVVSTICKGVKEFYGIDTKVKHTSFPKETHQINMRDYIADTFKLKLDTGWKPKVNFEDGIRRTIQFYKNE